MAEQQFKKRPIAASLHVDSPMGVMSASFQGTVVRLVDGNMRARAALDQFGCVGVTMPDGRKEIVVVPNQPQPIFRKRQLIASATVKDGHTLVLAGGSSHFSANPMRGQAFQPGAKIPTNTARTHLLIFVTPTLVDPAGNRINPPE